MKYSLKCTCGHVMTVDADSMDSAKAKFREMMTPEAIAGHAAEKHPGEPVPTKEQSDQMISQNVVEGDLNAPEGSAPPTAAV